MPFSPSEPFKRIAVVDGSYEYNQPDYRVFNGLLVDDYYAMYFDKDRALWLEPVKRVRDDLYITHDMPGFIVATEVDRGEIVIYEIMNRIVSMSAWDFITQVIIPLRLEIELELDSERMREDF